MRWAYILCDQTHDTIAFESTTDLPASFLCCSTDLFAVIPAIDQDMRLGIWNRFEILDFLHCQRNFALEGLVFLFIDPLLAVHPDFSGQR